jgi:hypothetical protein
MYFVQVPLVCEIDFSDFIDDKTDQGCLAKITRWSVLDGCKTLASKLAKMAKKGLKNSIFEFKNMVLEYYRPNVFGFENMDCRDCLERDELLNRINKAISVSQTALQFCQRLVLSSDTPMFDMDTLKSFMNQTFPMDMRLKISKFALLKEREDQARLYIEKHLFFLEVSERLFEVVESDQFVYLCNDCVETLLVLRKIREKLTHKHEDPKLTQIET